MLQKGGDERRISCEGDLLLRIGGKSKTYRQAYFVLDEAGTLTCSRKKDGPIDQSISIYSAQITYSSGHSSIHIDSDRSAWHLKCLPNDPYNRWRDAIHAAVQTRAQSGTVALKDLDGYKAKLAHLLAKMQAPLSQLNDVSKQLSSQNEGSGAKGLKKVLKPLKITHKQETPVTDQGDDIEELYGQLVELHRHLTELATQPFEQTVDDATAPNEPTSPPQTSYLDSIKAAVGLGKGSEQSEKEEDVDVDEDASNDAEGTLDRGDGSSSEDEARSKELPTSKKEDKVKRRNKLPSPQKAGKTGSAFGLLKNSIGKDLTKISFPVTLNEPLSALQRVAEELQYCDLLTKASAAESLVEKLAFIAAYAVSPMAGTKTRVNKKPFNAMFGETYELIREDMGCRFVSEKVSHHPPIHAFHAEELEGRWSYEGASTANQKFWGRSVEVYPQSSVRLKMGNDVFIWKERPSVVVRGIMSSGGNSIEYASKLEIKHESSSAKVTVRFSDGGKNEIKGSIHDKDGKEAGHLRGYWDERVSLKAEKDTWKDLWVAEEPLKDQDRYFGFSSNFSRQLNEKTEVEDGKLPPTDTRLRPDQLAYENGEMDKAEEIKGKLEERQRERRRDWKAGGGGESQPPQYFEKKGGDLDYRLTRDYWKLREKGDWPDFEPFGL